MEHIAICSNLAYVSIRQHASAYVSRPQHSYMFHREESRRASCFVFLCRFSRLSMSRATVDCRLLRQDKALQLCLLPQKDGAKVQQHIYMGFQFTRGQCCPPERCAQDIFAFCIPEYAAFKKKKTARIHTHTPSLSLLLTHV
jgi:hypothetical protein